MKFMRQRRPSINGMLGITQAKRRIARATGIPTTRSGRKRKLMNGLTGGAYGRYQRARADIHRPRNHMRRPPTPMGCLVWLISAALALAAVLVLAFG